MSVNTFSSAEFPALAGESNAVPYIKQEIEEHSTDFLDFENDNLNMDNVKIEPLPRSADDDFEEDLEVLNNQKYPFLATVLRPKVTPAKHHEARYEECNICGKTVKYLEKHLETHEGVQPEECSVCGKKVKHMDKHMEVHEDGVPVVKCTICGKKVKYLERHMEMHEDKRFACTYCNKVFSRKCYIQNHVREKHKGLPFKILEVDKSFVEARIKAEMNDPVRIAKCTCTYCGTVCKTTKGLTNHLWMKHKKYTVLSEGKKNETLPGNMPIKKEPLEAPEEDTNFKCSFCGILCKLSQSLTNHLKAKHDKTPEENIEHAQKLADPNKNEPEEIHQCPECGIICKTAKTLSNHQQYKHKNEQYICHHCGKIFACKPYLKLHIRLMHLPVVLIKCPRCDEHFKRKSSLSRHMKTHIPKSQRQDKQFPCEHCPEYFTTRRDLLEHIKITHKALTCFMCDEVFFNKVDFGKHVITHSEYNQQVELRPFACDICGKRFQIESYCKSHRALQHTADGNTNKCSDCGKEFLNAILLKKHKRNHARKYKCHICNVTCLRRAKLDKHIAIHMVDTPFKCKYCNSSFQARVALHSHLRWHASQNIKNGGTNGNLGDNFQNGFMSNSNSESSFADNIHGNSEVPPDSVAAALNEDIKNTEILRAALVSNMNRENESADNGLGHLFIPKFLRDEYSKESMHWGPSSVSAGIKIKEEKDTDMESQDIPHEVARNVEQNPSYNYNYGNLLSNSCVRIADNIHSSEGNEYTSL